MRLNVKLFVIDWLEKPQLNTFLRFYSFPFFKLIQDYVIWDFSQICYYIYSLTLSVFKGGAPLQTLNLYSSGEPCLNKQRDNTKITTIKILN
jgi:hypothetical protein